MKQQQSADLIKASSAVFFQSIGLDPQKLSQEEKQKIAKEFLAFFMIRALEDFPQLEKEIEKYAQEFQRLREEK